MRFLVDECAGPRLAHWLRSQDHVVFSVFEEARGLADEAILAKAWQEEWVLITADKDFGERIYRDRHAHKGVILLRLADERAANKIQVVERVLTDYSDRLTGNYVVVTEKRIRFAHK